MPTFRVKYRLYLKRAEEPQSHFDSLNLLDENALMKSLGPNTGVGTLLAKTDSVVFSIISLFPSPRKRAEAVEILRTVQDFTRPVPGCLGCWVSDDDFLHDQLRYAEQWETEEALHEHIRYDMYARVLAAMELSKQAPEVQFYFCSERKGLELVESLRRKDKRSNNF